MNGYSPSDQASQACIMYLYTKCWEGAKVLDPEVMKRLGPSDWLKGRKHLVDPKLLDPIRASQAQARKKLKKLALPFPIASLHLVPKGVLDLAEKTLQECMVDYWEKVDVFIGQYAQAREEARDSLGEYFNDGDYPWDIRSKFGFTWQYLQLASPSEVSVLDYDMFLRERQKFENLMEDAREMAICGLREEFAELVRRMTDRLTGTEDEVPKIFRNSTVEKFQEFFDTFSARNALFNDERLAVMVAQAKSAMSGVEANDLRSDADLRRTIRRTMEKVGGEMDKAMVEVPRRKIRFAA